MTPPPARPVLSLRWQVYPVTSIDEIEILSVSHVSVMQQMDTLFNFKTADNSSILFVTLRMLVNMMHGSNGTNKPFERTAY
jgi:hypothetical protein